jgi:hypothetical protein
LFVHEREAFRAEVWRHCELGNLGCQGVLRRVFLDVIARVVVAREELEIDETAAARAVLADLEDDLVVLLERSPSR